MSGCLSSEGQPFAVILLLIIYALYIGFSQEIYVETYVEKELKYVKEDHRLTEAVASAVKEEIADLDPDA